MLNHTGRLVLTTLDPAAAPDRESLRWALSKAGFIGAPRSGGGEGFSVGPHLLTLLSFTGCAVVLPPSDTLGSYETGCHVRILGPTPAPRFLWGRNTRGPRCRVCRARLKDWMDQPPPGGASGQGGWSCPKCGAQHPPWIWDWKQQAGFGRLFVVVEQVFPGEAVPTQALMDLLTPLCNCGWHHFYVQD